jgi:hypothetical protein
MLGANRIVEWPDVQKNTKLLKQLLFIQILTVVFLYNHCSSSSANNQLDHQPIPTSSIWQTYRFKGILNSVEYINHSLKSTELPATWLLFHYQDNLQVALAIRPVTAITYCNMTGAGKHTLQSLPIRHGLDLQRWGISISEFQDFHQWVPNGFRCSTALKRLNFSNLTDLINIADLEWPCFLMCLVNLDVTLVSTWLILSLSIWPIGGLRTKGSQSSAITLQTMTDDGFSCHAWLKDVPWAFR